MKHNLLLVSIIAIILLSVFAQAKHAQAAKLTMDWSTPTLNSDGSVLTNLAGFRIEWGSCTSTGAFGVYQAGLNVGPAFTTTPVYPTGLNPVCFRIYAINSVGVLSAPAYASYSLTPQQLGQPVRH